MRIYIWKKLIKNKFIFYSILLLRLGKSSFQAARPQARPGQRPRPGQAEAAPGRVLEIYHQNGILKI